VAPRGGSRAYSRREPEREPYDLVLIVCEGTRTEPSYFRGLRLIERLSNTNIRITPADGTDPLSIVRYAEQLADDYDRTYCVFDRNGHANYDDALRRLAQSQVGRAGRLIAVPSWPCFEIWLLLHFRYSSAAIVKAGRKSAGDRAVDELKRHLPNYRKGHEGIYQELLPNLDQAITHAARLRRDNERTGNNNPSTRVHELVQYLRRLKAR
jgi:hypothetical protein